MPSWITLLGVLSKLILVFLLVLSVYSISIMIDRRRVFEKLREEDSSTRIKPLIEASNWTALDSWAKSNTTLLAGAVHAATSIDLSKPESAPAVEHAIRSYVSEKRLEIEKGLTVLASLGSNAPFIGLFGTVLGIIQAFGALAGAHDSGLNLVLFGIAEALVATAVGLFVAIPAVAAYNIFLQKEKILLTEIESIKEYILSRVVRNGR